MIAFRIYLRDRTVRTVVELDMGMRPNESDQKD